MVIRSKTPTMVPLMALLDRPGLVVVLLQDLEDISVRIAEEEPCEWRVAQGLDQHGALRLQPFFQLGQLDTRNRDGDVPAKLTLESRGFETPDPRSGAAPAPARS